MGPYAPKEGGATHNNRTISRDIDVWKQVCIMPSIELKNNALYKSNLHLRDW